MDALAATTSMPVPVQATAMALQELIAQQLLATLPMPMPAGDSASFSAEALALLAAETAA